MKKIIVMLFLGLTVLSATAENCLPSFPNRPTCPKNCEVNRCCGKMGGISYCDRTAGRYVCNNGAYSTCYCTRHAIMDLQNVNGCCLWQGGVLSVTPEQIVICNDGSISEECSILSRAAEKVY